MLEIILFLVGSCSSYTMLVDAFPDAHVYCTGDVNYQWARMHLAGFEQYYHVVYVQDDPVDTPAGKATGWWVGPYSLSTPYKDVIKHELQHATCKCHETADGWHN